MAQGSAKPTIKKIEDVVKVIVQNLRAGEDDINDVQKVEQRFSYIRLSISGTAVIKDAPGFLHTLTVTGGTAGTITVHDGITDTAAKIADFDSTNALETYTFDIAFSSGLTVVTSANTKLTVSYR